MNIFLVFINLYYIYYIIIWTGLSISNPNTTYFIQYMYQIYILFFFSNLDSVFPKTVFLTHIFPKKSVVIGQVQQILSSKLLTNLIFGKHCIWEKLIALIQRLPDTSFSIQFFISISLFFNTKKLDCQRCTEICHSLFALNPEMYRH